LLLLSHSVQTTGSAPGKDGCGGGGGHKIPEGDVPVLASSPREGARRLADFNRWGKTFGPSDPLIKGLGQVGERVYLLHPGKTIMRICHLMNLKDCAGDLRKGIRIVMAESRGIPVIDVALACLGNFSGSG